MKALGDELKEIEKNYSLIVPQNEVMFVRLDGKNFSSWTKNFESPYSEVFAEAMIQTCVQVCSEFKADAGYVQSDEMTLMWVNEKETSQHLFGGKINKMNSVLASYVSTCFNQRFTDVPVALFDCRTFGVPYENRIKPFLWRFKDASKNGVSQIASHHFSSKELYGKTTQERKIMLQKIGVEYESFPSHLQEGTFIQRIETESKLTWEELMKIPSHVKIDPEQSFSRKKHVVVEKNCFFDNLR